MNRTIASPSNPLLVTDSQKQQNPQNLLSYGEATELHRALVLATQVSNAKRRHQDCTRGRAYSAAAGLCARVCRAKMKPAEAGGTGGATDNIARAGALITYTEAIVLTGLSYQQLRRGVKDNRIPATPGRPFHPVKLLKLAVLEFAEAKGYRDSSPVETLPDFTDGDFTATELPPDFWDDGGGVPFKAPAFVVLEPKQRPKLPTRPDPALKVLQEVDHLYIELSGNLEAQRGSEALIKLLERDLDELWSVWQHLELHEGKLRRDNPAFYAAEHAELERKGAKCLPGSSGSRPGTGRAMRAVKMSRSETEAATLKPRHAEQLASSAIDPDVIAARGYRTVTGKPELLELKPRFGKAQQRVPGLLIPIYRLGEPEPYAYVLRPDKPRISDGKPIKYEWPQGVAPCLDILPRHRDHLTDPTKTLLFTEGAKKADSGSSRGYVAINLNGVYGWRGRRKLAVKRSWLTSNIWRSRRGA